jgi:hypothetical protein
MDSITINKNIVSTPDKYFVGDAVTETKSIVTDVIVIVDESGSMKTMGNEPVQSVNAFLEEQKINSIDDGATFTLITFSAGPKVLVDHVPIVFAKEIEYDSYNPSGSTSLNDVICWTIGNELDCNNPNNKIVLIITDGEENSSRNYSTSDTRLAIADCQDNHDWKFIFIGANIDAFATGENISVNRSQCSQFVQDIPGDLLQMCRQTSCNISAFRRARTEGFDVPDLIAVPSLATVMSCPVDEKEQNRKIRSMLDHVPLKRSKAFVPELRSLVQSPTSFLSFHLEPNVTTIPSFPPDFKK